MKIERAEIEAAEEIFTLQKLAFRIENEQLYGYRVYGPYDPANGHRFNPNKLRLAPYAKVTVGPLDWVYPQFGYKLGDKGEDFAFDVGRAPPQEDAVLARHENERGGLDRRQEGRPFVRNRPPPRDRVQRFGEYGRRGGRGKLRIGQIAVACDTDRDAALARRPKPTNTPVAPSSCR